MADALQLDHEGRLRMRALYRISGVAQRYTVLRYYRRGNGLTQLPHTF